MIWEIHEQEHVIEGVDASGRPDPAYAAALGLLRAPFGRRSLAYVLDVTIWLILQLPLWLGAMPLVLKLATGAVSPYGFVNHPGFVLGIVTAAITVALSLVFVIVQLVLHGRRGKTIGKVFTGIRSVNVRTLEKPLVGAVLLRFLLVAVAAIVPFGAAVMLLSPTFDPERRGRGWHDKATKVWLVDVRKGLDPYDEKRMRIARKTVTADPLPERAELPSLATPRDPSALPEYRPGSRISAGVLGVARPQDRPAESLAAAPQPLATPTPAPGSSPTPASASTPAPASSSVPASAPAPAPASPPAPAFAPQPIVRPAAAEPAPTPQPAAQPASTPAPAPTPAAATDALPPEHHAAPTARFGLRLDTGESIFVSEPILLGRNPDAADHPGARPIPVVDGTRSLSKTHLAVRPVDGGLEVVDCRSTNGSGLIRDGVEYDLPAGVPVMTTGGDRIRLGDRLADVVRI